jgi:hypothetical protein
LCPLGFPPTPRLILPPLGCALGRATLALSFNAISSLPPFLPSFLAPFPPPFLACFLTGTRPRRACFGE